jgi:hypothetical protein
VVRVPGFRSRYPGFDSRALQEEEEEEEEEEKK